MSKSEANKSRQMSHPVIGAFIVLVLLLAGLFWYFTSTGYTAAMTWCATLTVNGASCTDKKRWNSKMAHIYCRPSLRGYLFVPEMTCRGVSICANEAKLPPYETKLLNKAMKTLKCPSP